MKRTFLCSNSSLLVKAFKTYILPILEYCSPVWSPTALVDILRLESVQRSFTKTLPDYSDLTYIQRLNKSGLSSLERRRLYADLTFFYKVIHKRIETDIINSIILDTTNSARGHSYKVRHLPTRLNVRLNFFTVRTIRVWNSLSEEVVCSDSVDSFRRALNNFNLDKFLTFV